MFFLGSDGSLWAKRPTTATSQPFSEFSEMVISSPNKAPSIGFRAAPNKSKPTDRFAADAGAYALKNLRHG